MNLVLIKGDPDKAGKDGNHLHAGQTGQHDGKEYPGYVRVKLSESLTTIVRDDQVQTMKIKRAA